jgi:hypothetical protein
MSDRRGDRSGSSLAALEGMPISSRFCSWVGLSGRRYVFTVYPASECPAFRDAVLMTVIRDLTGQRRVVSVRETGLFRNRSSKKLSTSWGPLAQALSSTSICWPRHLWNGQRPSPIWRSPRPKNLSRSGSKFGAQPFEIRIPHP